VVFQQFLHSFAVMTAQTPLIVVLAELRKTMRALVLTVCLATLLIFFLTPRLLQVVQAHLSDKLYFFAVAEPFLAHVKLALFGAVYGLIPWIMTVFWRAMAKPFKVNGLEVFFFVLFTCLLFYAGTLFCYFITLPFGVKFLLGFGSEQLRPVISVSRFVNRAAYLHGLSRQGGCVFAPVFCKAPSGRDAHHCGSGRFADPDT
jgi:sec-independent protein translocase protein TatC